MSEDPGSLVLRYLKRLDEKVDRLQDEVSDLKHELSGIKSHIAGTMQIELARDGSFASYQRRLERVERRLDQVEDTK